MVKIDGFRRALKAALEGPDLKDVEWTTFGHDFNVKKVRVTKSAGGLTIDGTDGNHISHRKRFRPDDQVFYQCRVTKDGEVEDLQVNIRSSLDVIKSWFETAGEIAAIVGLILAAGDAAEGKADDQKSPRNLDEAVPTPASVELLDGDWESDVDFMIANIVSYAAARELPELASKAKPDSGFHTQITTIHPAVLERFRQARSRIGGS